MDELITENTKIVENIFEQKLSIKMTIENTTMKKGNYNSYRRS